MQKKTTKCSKIGRMKQNCWFSSYFFWCSSFLLQVCCILLQFWFFFDYFFVSFWFFFDFFWFFFDFFLSRFLFIFWIVLFLAPPDLFGFWVCFCFFLNRFFSVDCFNKSVFEYVFVFFCFSFFLAKTTLCGSRDVIILYYIILYYIYSYIVCSCLFYFFYTCHTWYRQRVAGFQVKVPPTFCRWGASEITHVRYCSNKLSNSASPQRHVEDWRRNHSNHLSESDFSHRNPVNLWECHHLEGLAF